jgi:hypothetical protein
MAIDSVSSSSASSSSGASQLTTVSKSNTDTSKMSASEQSAVTSKLSVLSKAVSGGVTLLNFDFESYASTVIKNANLKTRTAVNKPIQPTPAIPTADVFKKSNTETAIKDYYKSDKALARLDKLIQDKIAAQPAGTDRGKLLRRIREDVTKQLGYEVTRLGIPSSDQVLGLGALRKGMGKIFAKLSRMDLDKLTLPDAQKSAPAAPATDASSTTNASSTIDVSK